MSKCYTGLWDNTSNIIHALGVYNPLPDDDWLLMSTTSAPEVTISRYSRIDDVINVNACLQDGVNITRMFCPTGTMYVDEGSYLGVFLGKNATAENLFAMFHDAFLTYGVQSTFEGNDILIDGKKAVGIGRIVSDAIQGVGFAGNISTPIEYFAKYLLPKQGKAYASHTTRILNRILSLSDVIPGITPKLLFDTVIKEWKGEKEYPYEMCSNTPQFERSLSIVTGRAWLHHGLLPEEVYKVQSVTFANGRTVEVESIQGNTVQGQEQLIFVFPEQADVTFNDLLGIYQDPEATKAITITYVDQTGEEAERTRINAQVGFTEPIALSFADGKFHMTLGKRG